MSKLAGPLMKVAISLARNVLAPLVFTAAASAIHAGIEKKIHYSETPTISNKEMNDIMKIAQALENHNILLKVAKTNKNERKIKKEDF